MLRLLITIAVIFLAMVIYVVTHRVYKRFARQHPELGPFRSDKEGCGSCSGGSGCSGEPCDSETEDGVEEPNR